jgi:hypothetical protein
MVAPAKGESVPDDGQRNGHGSSSSVRPRVGSKRFETIGLPTERLRAPVREVLAGDGQPEITVQAVNRRGRSLTCRIELVPLDAIAGVRGAILMMHPHEEQWA